MYLYMTTKHTVYINIDKGHMILLPYYPQVKFFLHSNRRVLRKKHTGVYCLPKIYLNIAHCLFCPHDLDLWPTAVVYVIISVFKAANMLCIIH